MPDVSGHSSVHIGSDVDIQRICHCYGDKTVLDNVELSVDEGEFVSLVGPSGCGKSTLLRLILGQEEPTRGTILLDGKPAGYADGRRGIVYQKYSLYPHLTVLGNALLGPRMHGRKNTSVRDEAMTMLNRVGLAEAAGKYPHELSGGMQQRAAIVQALMTRPEVLMMDEPFAALDPPTRETLQMMLLELWQEYRPTVFFVTHDISEAMFISTRIVLLSQYYTDERGDYHIAGHGARVMMDLPLDATIFRVSDKNTPEFREMRDHIMRSGFSPEHMKRVDEFDLRHPGRFTPPTV